MDPASRELLQKAEGVKSIAPLDCALGIDRLPFKLSAGVMAECAYQAQDQISFQRAEEMIYKRLHISVDDDTLRKAAACIGKAVFEEDCQRAEEDWKAFSGKLLPKNPGTLYVALESGEISTRTPEKMEIRLGTVFSSENIRSKEYVGCMGPLSQFKKQILSAALRKGYGTFQTTVVLSDGSEWIPGLKEELFGEAVLILERLKQGCWREVLQKRFRPGGIRWEAETAQYLITLISKKESGLWQSEVVEKISEMFEC